MKCNICLKEFNSPLSLTIHLTKTHKITSQSYYDKYLKSEYEGICKLCKNKTNFINITIGYSNYCSHKCSNSSIEVKQKKAETNIKHLGVSNPSQSKKIKEKKKQTSLMNYGVLSPNQSPIVQEKRRQTCLKKYGFDHANQTYERRLKSRLRRIKEIEIQKLNNEPLMPHIGVKERQCLNELQDRINQTIKRNQRVLGYFPDGLIKELKLIIEYDESDHFISGSYRIHDIKKNEDLIKNGYRIFRVKDKDWIKNKEIIFKEFDVLINESQMFAQKK